MFVKISWALFCTEKLPTPLPLDFPAYASYQKLHQVAIIKTP
jgi:hypothetical protein